MAHKACLPSTGVEFDLLWDKRPFHNLTHQIDSFSIIGYLRHGQKEQGSYTET